MSGSHLDQNYLGEEAPTALVATASAPASSPGSVDPTTLVAAPLAPKSTVILLGIGAGVVAYAICRALQGGRKT
jgi:hypothetical protein